jgi:aldehyde dehydrogenase (NAD+)
MEVAEHVVRGVSIEELFKRQQEKALAMRTAPLADRKKKLKALRDWIFTNRARIQEAAYKDFRKPAAEVDGTEIFPVVSEIKLALAHLDEWAAPTKIDAPLTFIGTRSYIKAEPKGVCLIIAPWNFPFMLAIGPLVSAIAAGNTAFIKPSEMTPHTSAVIATMVSTLYNPAEVTVAEGGAEVSRKLTSLPFDHIFFTGSPQVGKLVMKAAAENLTSVTLELGGKSPAFVTRSARIEEAAERLAVGKFANCGQTCIAPDYVLADKEIAEKLVEALKKKVIQRFAENNEPIEKSPHYARIVNEKHWLRLNGLLEDAIKQGAHLATGGKVSKEERLLDPTILTDVPLTARIMEEEIFGPILPVVAYSTLDEAISIVNSKPKPLALYVYSQSRHEQQQVLSRTSSGTAVINDNVVHFLNEHLPFGGVNNSGMGNAHGHYGFIAFSHMKPVMKQRNGMTSIKPLYPPYTPAKARLTNWLFKLFK